MGNVHLVTGYAGTEHIAAKDHGAFHAAVFGTGGYVLNIGKKLAITVNSNNQVTVASGDLLIQGRHVRLENSLSLTINSGSQGYKRNDLIVARYSKDSATGLEDCSLVVVRGTATTGTAKDPTVTTGNILNGTDIRHDMPLYRIPLDGLTVGTPVLLATVLDGFGGQNIQDAVATAVNNALGGGGTIADYITEQGYTSGCRWRKWKSGKKEIWKTGTLTSVAISTNHGGVYCSTAYATILPITFDTVEAYSLQCRTPDSDSFLLSARVKNWGDIGDRCNMQFCSHNGSESQVNLEYTLWAIGT